MVNRKSKHIEDFLEEINRVWSLSLNDREVLDSFLNLFLAGKNEEIKKIEHLLNDETEELLKLLNDREVIDYVIEQGGFITSDDESGLEDALVKLNYDFSDKVDLDTHIRIVEDNDFVVKYKGEEFETNFDNVDYQLFLDIYNKFENSNTFERQELRDKIV